jgi:hypothetical protein
MRKLFCLLITCLGLSASAQDKPEDNLLFNCFKQLVVKGEDNGTSVAFIKAAMGTFGVNNVFRNVNTDNAAKQHTILLRNGVTVVLNFAEVEEAGAAAGFMVRNNDLLSADIRRYALLCYAAMAKNLQVQRALPNYTAGIAMLNNNYPAKDIAALLGLMLKPIKPCTVEELSRYNHIMVRNNYYTSYAYLGYYDEVKLNIGFAPLEEFRKNHFGVSCAYKRCQINAAYRVDEI